MRSPRALLVLGDRVQISLADVVVHLAVPVAMVLAYVSLPYEAFLFRPGESGLVGAYRMLFGHADPAHLLGNAGGFLALGGLSLLLLTAASRRRLYYACFVAVLGLVPPLGALQWVAYLSATDPGALGRVAGSGFSVVTAAFAALLAVAVAIHRRECLDARLGPIAASACLAALVVSVPAASVGSGVRWTLLGAGLGGVGLLYVAAAGRTAIGHLNRRNPDEAVHVGLSAVALGTFVGATIDLFGVPTGAALRAHVTGFVLGYLLVWTVRGLERIAVRRREAGG